MVTGTDLVHIPYKGGAPATAALLGGQEAQVGFVGMGPVLPHVQSGKLHALAISTAKRAPQVPQVPTLQEAGLKGFDFRGWMALAAPAGTPPEIISRLNAEANKALLDRGLRTRLEELGLEVAGGTTEELLAFIDKEADHYAKIVKAAGIPLQ